MKIKNLAEFKRAMELNSKWNFYEIIKGIDSRPVVRTCVASQSNSFALDSHPKQKDSSIGSWLDYPKAKQMTFVNNVGESTRVKIKASEDFYLVYQPIAE